MAGMAHRYCCRVSHRPALVSLSLVASTRTMLMKRTKLSCGREGGLHLEAASQKGGDKGTGTHGPARLFLPLRLQVAPWALSFPIWTGTGISCFSGLGALTLGSREASIGPCV